jgi:hypothetical protein
MLELKQWASSNQIRDEKSQTLLNNILYLLQSIFFYFATVMQNTKGALTPINQNAIKQGKFGNMERGQTERGKSE